MEEGPKLLVLGLLLVVGGGARILWPGDERGRARALPGQFVGHRDRYAKVGGALVMLVGVAMIWGWTTTGP